MTGLRFRFLPGSVISATLALAVLAPETSLAGPPPPARAPIGRATAAACVPGENILCLNNARFAVSVEWRDFQGNTGQGEAIRLTGDTGYFWFFTNTNVELVVKVLDAAAINGHFWVFYGALSNVEYTITVIDTATLAQKTYSNPSGEFGSVGDTQAFPSGSLVAGTSDAAEFAGASGGEASPDAIIPAVSAKARQTTCTPDATALCLTGDRYRVEVNWKDFQGKTGRGQAIGLTADTGYFWFFNSANVELVVKVLDATGVNGKHWVFYGALSNVEYEIVVIDTQTGESRRYTNPSGQFASAGDTTAFPLPPGTPQAAYTAVGTPNGEPATGSIGPAGGSLTSVDGVATLTVPPNALTSTVDFTITPITNEAPGGDGNAYQFDPEGQTFAIPAEISLSYDQELTGSFEADAGVAYQDDQQFWRVVEPTGGQAVTRAGSAGGKRKRSIKELKPHYVQFYGYELSPKHPRVIVGTTRDFTLMACPKIDEAEGLPSLLGTCSPATGDVRVTDWHLNYPAHGTLHSPGPYGVTYQAPATKPELNIDLLGAYLGRGSGSDFGVAVASILIVDDTWVGHADFRGPAWTGHADVTWTLESTTNNISLYRATGTATVAWRGSGCSITPSSFTGALDDHVLGTPRSFLYVDRNTNPPTYYGAGTVYWTATLSCPPGDPFTSAMGVSFLLQGQADAILGSGDNETILGNDVGNGNTTSWEYTRPKK